MCSRFPILYELPSSELCKVLADGYSYIRLYFTQNPDAWQTFISAKSLDEYDSVFYKIMDEYKECFAVSDVVARVNGLKQQKEAAEENRKRLGWEGQYKGNIVNDLWAGVNNYLKSQKVDMDREIIKFAVMCVIPVFVKYGNAHMWYEYDYVSLQDKKYGEIALLLMCKAVKPSYPVLSLVSTRRGMEATELSRRDLADDYHRVKSLLTLYSI